ncbi:MAG: methyltransferase [Planctomycetes bacterium]|nr:methyltransferase [Planctomycetota bacterium]MCC7172355.1 methyltransferase [Planctomycetota bacterium]
MTPASFVLGNPQNAETTQSLRGGALSFRSRRGLHPIARLAIEALPKQLTGDVLTGFSAEPAVALAVRAVFPDVRVRHFELDLFVAARARAVLAQNDASAVEVVAAADLPGVRYPGDREDAVFEGTPFAAVILPFPARGDAKLARDLVEQAALVLAAGAPLYAITDHADGEWVKEVVRDVFGKADAVLRTKDDGVAFIARRGDKKVRAKDRVHDVLVEHGGHSLAFASRPGTFTYGRLDGGTRALLMSRALAALAPRENEVVLDLGAGIGILGVAVARARGSARAVLVESNVRAAELARANASRAGIDTAIVAAPDALALADGSADLALTNPPYFANFRIAEQFVGDAFRCLRPGGTLLLVAKERTHHSEIVRARFGHVEIEDVGEYGVFHATR